MEYILNNKPDFMKYLKSRFKMIHNSNFFFRDFHYGVLFYLQEHGIKKNYQIAEKIARGICESFELQGIFKKIDHQTWTLNYPEFALPRINKKT